MVLNTLNSVFEQDYNDFEVIVVNDGSTDGTSNVLDPLVTMGKIRYFEQANQGISAARNFGAEQATGKYLAFLDDDDAWPSDKLSWQVAAMEEAGEDAVLVYGQSRVEIDGKVHFGPHGEAHCGFVQKRFFTNHVIQSPGQTLIRKTAFDKIKGFDATLWGVDDWDFYVRCAGLGNVLFEPKCALFYRIHENNASRDFVRMSENAVKSLDKNISIVTFDSERERTLAYRRLKRSFLADRMMNSAIYFASIESYAKSLLFLFRCICINPPSIINMRVHKRVAKMYFPDLYDSLKTFGVKVESTAQRLSQRN